MTPAMRARFKRICCWTTTAVMAVVGCVIFILNFGVLAQQEPENADFHIGLGAGLGVVLVLPLIVWASYVAICAPVTPDEPSEPDVEAGYGAGAATTATAQPATYPTSPAASSPAPSNTLHFPQQGWDASHGGDSTGYGSAVTSSAGEYYGSYSDADQAGPSAPPPLYNY